MSKENIVFIFSDEHNANIMSNAKDKYVKTPNLDKLNDMSVKFNNCYCQAPLCVPSRASLLTGNLPLDCKVMNNDQSISPNQATMAHSINNAGYETILVGRMHFGGAEQNYGYEKHLVGDMTPYYHGHDGYKNSIEQFEPGFKQRIEGLVQCGVGSTSTYEYDKEVCDTAVEYLKNREDERPIFMTIGLTTPHPPFIANKERFEYFYNLLPEITTHEDFKANLHPAMERSLKNRGVYDIDPIHKKTIRAAYYCLVEYLDERVGQILDGIENTIGLENTVIVYSSDHGESMGVNDLFWKGFFYEDAVKCPLLISVPNCRKSTQDVNELCALLDINKTLLDIAGAQPLPGAYGQSLLPVVKGEEKISSDRSIVSQLGGRQSGFKFPSAMIRKNNYKLISYYSEGYALFDLDNDPNEIYNVAEKEQYKTILQELVNELEQTWNGEEAHLFAEKAKANFDILEKWINNAKIEIPDNWHCKPNSNYITYTPIGKIKSES